jgi:hypothetical protein
MRGTEWLALMDVLSGIGAGPNGTDAEEDELLDEDAMAMDGIMSDAAEAMDGCEITDAGACATWAFNCVVAGVATWPA